MDQNTMQLAIVPSSSPNEGNEDGTQPKRWYPLRRAPRKHRMLDENARLRAESVRLRADLEASQGDNRELSESLNARLAERQSDNERLTERVEELKSRVSSLEAQLKKAWDTHISNSHPISFSFSRRPTDAVEDQATMPVPQVELLADTGSLKTVNAGNAGNGYENTRVYNKVQGQWRVRQSPATSPGARDIDMKGILVANMSTTGTYRVAPLRQRGTGPTSIPGHSA